MELFLSYQIKRSVCIILQLVNFVPVVSFTNCSTSAHQKFLTLCNRCYFKFYWSENDLTFLLNLPSRFSFMNDKIGSAEQHTELQKYTDLKKEMK